MRKVGFGVGQKIPYNWKETRFLSIYWTEKYLENLKYHFLQIFIRFKPKKANQALKH